MKQRRIVIYENINGKGEVVASSVQSIDKNNIFEKDIATFILKLEKDPNFTINPLLVMNYLRVSKQRIGPIDLFFDYLAHPEDYKILPVKSDTLTQETKDCSGVTI